MQVSSTIGKKYYARAGEQGGDSIDITNLWHLIGHDTGHQIGTHSGPGPECLLNRPPPEHLLRLRPAARADQRHQRDAGNPQDGRLRLAPRIQGEVVIGGTTT